jgi:3-oxoacyl-[acyl-carrier-protein] synthase-3
VKPGSLLLMPAFGAGLTLCAHLVRWGSRVTPLGTTDVDLPPCTRSALEMVNEIRAIKAEAAQRSGAALLAPKLAETLGLAGAVAPD